MFKEDYIKDNNQIHPDEDFLKELRETIQDEKQKIAKKEEETSVEIFIGQENDYQGGAGHRHKRTWAGWAVAACAAFVCILGVMSVGIDLDFGNDSLKGDVKSVFHSSAEDEKSGNGDKTERMTENSSEVSTGCREQYQRVLRMLQQQNVILYETENFMLGGSGMEYLHRDAEDSMELGREERSELVGGILAEKYTLVENTENLGNPIYYIAEFEDGSGVSFIIGGNEYIYIHEVWGLQSLAEVYN